MDTFQRRSTKEGDEEVRTGRSVTLREETGDRKECHWEDTVVVDAIQSESSVGEPSKAIAVQPRPQRDVLLGMREREKGNDGQVVRVFPCHFFLVVLPTRPCLPSTVAFNHSLCSHPVTPPLPSLGVQKE